jgi:hypothetical protein
MMIAGCFGLLAACADVLELGEESSRLVSSAGSSGAALGGVKRLD